MKHEPLGAREAAAAFLDNGWATRAARVTRDVLPMMHRDPLVLAAVVAMFNIVGCASEDGLPLPGWQAIHANAEGDGWRGPIRRDHETALADADAYARRRGVKRDEIMVLAIYPGMETSGQLPPNPLAELALGTRVTLETINDGND